jgi:subtilisin family serine protease
VFAVAGEEKGRQLTRGDFRFRGPLVLVATALLVVPVAARGVAAERPAAHGKTNSIRQRPRRPRFDPKTVLVKFKADVPPERRREVLVRHGAVVQAAVKGTRFSRVRVDDAERARARLAADPAIAVAELNRVRYALATPNDPRFAADQQYLLPLRLPAAWDVSRGSVSVKVAIVDTGVDLDHPDLSPRVVAGYDFVNNDAIAQDDEGHGTMVAGVAAAATNNGIGIAGVAWNASIMPVKVLDETGSGYDFDIARGITWAADNGAQVINLSLGGPWSSVTLYDAIDYARKKGAVVVAAAGNDGAPQFSYPAFYADIAVAATDAAGDAAWFSNSGYWVDVTAPGIGVTSTALAAGPAEAYATGSGTSFASPIAAGLLALVWAQHPGWTQAQVGTQLVRAWDRGPRGLDAFYGFGVVDALAAVGGSAQQTPAPQPPGDSHEPNGAPKRATVITASSTGTISPEGDEDDFAVDVNGPKWFSATVTPPRLAPSLRASEVDPSITVLGPRGQRLAWGVDNTAGRREAALVPAGGAGRYYLDVTSRASARGSYTVEVADAAAPAQLDPEVWLTLPSAATPRDVALADITGDGRKDVVTTTVDGTTSPYKLMLVPQRSTGGLGDAVAFPANVGYAHGLATADVDGDGATDVVVATMAGPQIYYARSGTLADPTVLAQPTVPRGLAVADMNGDGRPDIVTLGEDSSIRIFRNDGGAFTPTVVTPAGVWRIAVGDLTGDGRRDIAACAGDGTIAVFEQGLDGSFTKRRYDHWCGDDLLTADMNGDGRTDLVSNAIGTQVFTQTTAGLLDDPDTYEGHGHGYLAAGDLNGDGRNDLTAIAHFDIDLQQLSQLANGVLAVGPRVNRSLFMDGPLAIGDVTGDGRADIVLGEIGEALVVFPQASSTAPPPLEPASFWIENETPPDFALDVTPATEPVLDFDDDLEMRDGAQLVSGLSGREAPIGVRHDPPSLSTTIRPATGLAPGTPYILARYAQFYDPGPRLSYAYTSYRFATAGTADPSVPDTTVTGDPQYWVEPASPVFTFTSSKLGAMFECSLDAVGFYPCTSPRTYEGLDAGAHTFHVRALDAAGRVDPSPATVTWTVRPSTPGVPYNDEFVAAIPLRVDSSSFSLNTVGATKEPGEPNHAGNAGGTSVWVRWTAPRSGSATIDTRGSALDTLLAVYTGSSVSSLTPVTSNDNVSASDTTSKVTFSAAAGTTYQIALDGKNGASGSVSFNFTAALGRPANDNFANAQTIMGSAGTIVASNAGATAEAGEPDAEYFPQPKSIWYRWTAPRSGLFSFDVNGSATGRSFDLYAGSSLPALSAAGVKVGAGRGGHIYLVATVGVTYVIRLDDQYNPGDWVLNWSDGVSSGAPDTTPPEDSPTVSSTHATDWSNDNTVDVAWSGASDAGSGVDGFSYEWSQSAATAPDTVKDAEETATGTTSPPLADGQWWFHLRTGDNAGNWTAPVRLGPFKIDTTAPANPALSSSSHVVGTWSLDASVEVAWADALDGASGVDGFSYEWSQNSATTPDQTKDGTGSSATSPALTDGSWWFHLRTVDAAGNWSFAVHLGPFKIDTTPPANPSLSSTRTSGWSPDRSVDAVWSGAADAGSGVSGYSLEWSQSASTAPDETQDTNGSTATSPQLADGSWWFHLRTRDNAGNWSSTSHLGPFRVDGTAPANPGLSSPSHSVDEWSNDPTVEIVWFASSDAHSGVDGFSYGWSQEAATDPGTVKTVEETMTGTTSPALADGSWWFHLRTGDDAGNWSNPVHLGPFKIDVTAPTNPVLSSPSHTIDSWSSETTVVVTWSAGDGVEGYSYEWSQSATTVPDAIADAGAATSSLSAARPDGSWWFHLRALRSAWGWSGASHIGPFRIDTTPPETAIVVAPPAETADRGAAFEFSSSEALGSFSCSLDDGTFADCSSPTGFAALEVGLHTFRVEARDRAGNVDPAPAEHRWRIVAPPAAPPPPAPTPPPSGPVTTVAVTPPPVPPAPTPPAKKSPVKKVTLCHKGRTIRVRKSEVRKHRRHGDKLGPCRRKRPGR